MDAMDDVPNSITAVLMCNENLEWTFTNEMGITRVITAITCIITNF